MVFSQNSTCIYRLLQTDYKQAFIDRMKSVVMCVFCARIKFQPNVTETVTNDPSFLGISSFPSIGSNAKSLTVLAKLGFLLTPMFLITLKAEP